MVYKQQGSIWPPLLSLLPQTTLSRVFDESQGSLAVPRRCTATLIADLWR